MANHGPSYGLDAELKAKQNSKYDRVAEGKVIAWINSVVGTSLTPENLHEELKSGVVLCKYVSSFHTIVYNMTLISFSAALSTPCDPVW